jgi:N-acetylglucosamine kinase-like BadF-type ATPase
MTASDLLLVVDGGGTKTQAVVTDLAGTVLGRGLGPSSNLHNVGFEETCRTLTMAIEGALLHVLGPGARAHGPGWRSARIAAACFGLSGVDAPADEALISRWVREQSIASQFMVVNDAELVLAGGTPDGWGVALISGTGSVCLGRARDGRTARVGGWGPLLGDEGSGYDIAMRALRLASQAADGRMEAPALLKAILDHWSLAEPALLIHHVHAPERTAAELAALGPVVLGLAARNDPAARSVVDQAARDLAQHVDAIARTLRLQRPPLALGGGLLGGQLRFAVLSGVKTELGPVKYVPDPSQGAIVLARRLLTRSVSGGNNT